MSGIRGGTENMKSSSSGTSSENLEQRRRQEQNIKAKVHEAAGKLYSTPVDPPDFRNHTGSNEKAQKLLDYIAALKFDAAKDQASRKASKNEGSKDISLDSLLADKFSRGRNKGHHHSRSVKSKVTFNSTKSSRSSYDYLAQNFSSSRVLNSQQRLLQQKDNGKKVDPKNPTTLHVIRDWGKRPLLVETEAPWTPRNRMYFQAMKALSKINPQVTVPNGFKLPQGYPPGSMAPPPPNANLFMTQKPIPNSMGYSPVMQVPPSPTYYPPQQNHPAAFSLPIPNVPLLAATTPESPYVAGLPPLPVPNEINTTRPLAVTIDSQNPYQHEFLIPVQATSPPQFQHQTMMYGHLDSQGLWMPLIQQQQRQGQYQQQRQPQ